MRIAQVSPLFESVPPKGYGGTERIVSYLTEDLVNLGHEVTLFASGDSITNAHLVAPWCCALRELNNCRDQYAHHLYMLELVQKEIENFDIVHYHIDYLHFPLSRRSKIPNITTIHGRLDDPNLLPLYREYSDVPLISISDSQRTPLPLSNWKATIPHGLPIDLYSGYEGEGRYLAFIGRYSPEKRPDRAIELSRRTGIPLKMAAKIENLDLNYYNEIIKPLINQSSHVENLGEIEEREKNKFLGNAIALIFLIDWPEPFGLAMIEAMACGTPVIAWNNGSVPEIIDHGVTGFIVNSMEEAEQAIKKISTIDRKKVRKAFENKFTSKRMTNNYINAYKSVISNQTVKVTHEGFGNL